MLNSPTIPPIKPSAMPAQPVATNQYSATPKANVPKPTKLNAYPVTESVTKCTNLSVDTFPTVPNQPMAIHAWHV